MIDPAAIAAQRASPCRHPPLRHEQIRNVEGVDQNEIGQRREPEHGATHGIQRRLMDVDGVDLVALGARHRPAERAAQDHVVEPLALDGGHLLGVGQARDVAVGVEHDGARDHRTRETSASHFVDPCHA